MDEHTKNIGILKQARIKELKQFKKYANKVLDDNKKVKQTNSHKWENATIEKNIENLKTIIHDINYELASMSRIEKVISVQYDLHSPFKNLWNHNYCFMQNYAPFYYTKISKYTVSSSILHDINWLGRIDVFDKIKLSLEIEKPTILEFYWEELIEVLIKEILPKLKEIKECNEQVDLILDAIKIAKEDSFIISNLVIITVIESLVRIIAKEIYQKQNPNLQANEVENYIDDFQSLENLINKGGWKNDIEISIPHAVIEFGHINEPEIDKANESFDFKKKAFKFAEIAFEKLKTIPEKEYSIDELKENFKPPFSSDDIKKYDVQNTAINLKIQLHFLVRRFKEDRNAIVHGNYKGMNSKWKSYIYLSAIEKIYETIGIYQKIYPIFKR